MASARMAGPDVFNVAVPVKAFVADVKTLTELSAKLAEIPAATKNAAAKNAR
jgi:hypothetical protein